MFSLMVYVEIWTNLKEHPALFIFNIEILHVKHDFDPFNGKSESWTWVHGVMGMASTAQKMKFSIEDFFSK